MPIPEVEKDSASKLLKQFCETRIPARVRHQIELGFRFEGSVAYLFERRPDWRGSDEWMSMDIARFRYFIGRGEWSCTGATGMRSGIGTTLSVNGRPSGVSSRRSTRTPRAFSGVDGALSNKRLLLARMT